MLDGDVISSVTWFLRSETGKSAGITFLIRTHDGNEATGHFGTYVKVTCLI